LTQKKTPLSLTCYRAKFAIFTAPTAESLTENFALLYQVIPMEGEAQN